jgi:hypothetical protein
MVNEANLNKSQSDFKKLEKINNATSKVKYNFDLKNPAKFFKNYGNKITDKHVL